MSRSPRATTLAVVLAVVVVAFQALLVPLFAGPAAEIAPRDLPLAVAGPEPAATQLADQLRAAHPGAFDLRVVADADAAIRDREVYGAIVLGTDGPALHVASAAGPTVAALLTQATAELGRGAPVPVVDVVPTDPDDPRGAAFGAGFLPLAITGLLAGMLTFLLVKRRAARFVALGTFAVLAGLAGAAVQQAWLGVLPGDYLSVAAVLGLFGLAVSGTVAGLAAVLDRAGLALGALVVFLVGNALSGVSSAAELLPQPWGAVGQALPIGAGSTLLRSVAYFDGNGAGSALAVLCAYAIGGLLLVAAGRRGLARPAAEVAAAGPDRTPALVG
ncbi:hypothetical protein DMB66_56845 [Actinoplanes sp. ATCC 53533]|uniref:hypothetical protein n=1 Tax=Actinoplanes sp. ATCC 53533 TaxID=1288362 RepID=UPI000F780C3E|nr:hypothetical protein [Actinoplanes sp. ATCC 53533]RSM40679.1 hypothetical protein DMB66_56845 [Actinoplanes sp. ATCC 53533]